MRPTGEGPSWPRPHPPPRGSFSLHFNPVLSSTVQRPVRHEDHPTTTHFQNVPPSRTAPCPRGTPTASSLPFSRPHSHHLLPVSMTGLRGLRVSGISQHLSFRDHLASLSIKSSRFIRVLARFRISLLFFFFLRPNHTALCTRAMISLCIHPSVHTGVGGVLPLRSTPPSTPWGAPTPVAVRNAAVNSASTYLFEALLSVLSGAHPQVHVTTHTIIPPAVFRGAAVPRATAAASFRLPASGVPGRLFPHILLRHSSPSFLSPSLPPSLTAVPMGAKRHLVVLLMCTSLMVSDVEHLCAGF